MRRIHPGAFIAAAVVAVPLVIVTIIGLLGSFTATDGGTVAVIRNGGWFDSRDFRQVVQPGSSLTPTGWWSVEHDYPAAQRNFVVSARPDADSNEVITVPSKDGVSLGIEGTFYFQLTRDERALGQFDDKFGTRTYPTKDHGQLEAWRGVEGWNAFLNFTLGNLVQNDLRREVVRYNCADLVASCSLAQNAGQSIPPVAGKDQITAIQDAVNASFAEDVRTTLGGEFFVEIRFVLSKVVLDDKVQAAINDAQAAFAAVTKAQAGLQAEQITAQANAVKQQGYSACGTCAEIDKLRALPNGLTTYAPGAQYAVTGR